MTTYRTEYAIQYTHHNGQTTYTQARDADEADRGARAWINPGEWPATPVQRTIHITDWTPIADHECDCTQPDCYACQGTPAHPQPTTTWRCTPCANHE